MRLAAASGRDARQPVTHPPDLKREPEETNRLVVGKSR